ncbi:VWA domain-containing protein [Embleya sp. NBC_00896]|uniref:VWA domain-containing protein n=1 Tax=Embleya sp. NBC_00896 TaxID=2975961 RepID=UPI0038705C1F|nr:VWA domain-containing protein [Embleya sp. NBC_00896]
MSTLEPGTSTPLPDAITDLMLTWPAAEAMPRVDLCALLLGADGRVCAQRDAVVSRTEPTAASGAVWFLGADASTATIRITPSALPAAVARIVVVASIGDLPLARFPGLTVYAYSASTPFATWLARADTETALVLAEIHREAGGWRLTAVGRGHPGGLPDLLNRHASFGTPTALAKPAPIAVPPDPGLAGRMALHDREVAAWLRRRGLAGIRGRIVMVLDGSGSMNDLYKNGVVARTVERLASVAARLDTREVLDVWAFADRQVPLPPLYVPGIADWLPHVHPGGILSWSVGIGCGTDAVGMVRTILDRHVPPPGGLPVLVVFLSDGAIDVREVEQLVRDTANRPAFWQFVQVCPDLSFYRSDAEHQERVLAETNFLVRHIVRRQLRHASRPESGNVGSFAEEDLDALTDEQLYERLVDGFATPRTSMTRHGHAVRPGPG